MTGRGEFLDQGFLTFPVDDALAGWVAEARAAGRAAVADPACAHWLRCGGTWFVGVDALPNDAQGRVGGGPPLQGAAVDFIRNELGLALPLHRGQISVCYPGYPKPSADESEAAFDFRRKRDAAHVDGLLPEGPEKRRSLKEPHAYILGIGLTEQTHDAAPLSVWAGSHHVMRKMFEAAFAGHAPESWAMVDVTAAYQHVRRQVFGRCRRVELPRSPGEAVLLHRHLIHGVTPWGEAASASGDGRMIAYFRPEFPRPADWLSAP